MLVVSRRCIVRFCGRFSDFLEQFSPLLVEFTKGYLIVVQLRYDAQEEYM